MSLHAELTTCHTKFRIGRNITPSWFQNSDSARYDFKFMFYVGRLISRVWTIALVGVRIRLQKPSWVAKSRRNSSPSHQSGPGSCRNFMNFMIIYHYSSSSFVSYFGIMQLSSRDFDGPGWFREILIARTLSLSIHRLTPFETEIRCYALWYHEPELWIR